MSTIRVTLFGPFRVQSGEANLTGQFSYKAQELLCYLLLHRDHPHQRETLASILWGDENTTAQSRKTLRQTLWQLQTTLNSSIESGHGLVLRVEGDLIELNLGEAVWLDTAVFEQAFAAVQGVPGPEMSASDAQALHRAVELYRADLLEGWYQDWCLYERERFQNMYLMLLDKLMGYCEARYNYEDGLIYGMRILRYDGARERTHRRLMRLYCLAGDRSAALRQFQRCAAALEDELGVTPSRRTMMLYEQIREDQLTPMLPASPAPTTIPGSAAASLSEVLSSLRQIEAALTDLQRQVQRESEAVTAPLKGQR
ncbi:MAG TPA: hypothetical protein DEP84_36260 [Chloroflexi bacterium]|nr:hypothetical protein [Chloroflexota bacterium]